MGIVSSDFSRNEHSEVSWVVEHGGLGSPWSQFALRRYGAGFTATGVATSIALPRLMRQRLQDWGVRGYAVHLGENFVSFGRQLESLSRGDAELFFGVDIFFGDNSERASWFWYCKSQEWLLQLHKAVLEPLPPAQPSSDPQTVIQRWPGRPHFLGEEAPQKSQPPAPSQPTASSVAGAVPEGEAESAVATEVPASSGEPNGDSVDHQLCLYFSNADGHVGLLGLPVPHASVDATAAMVTHWSNTCEVPLYWAGRRWHTTEDFSRLRESALNLPDVLLLGLETELAMVLTPDWTWEKYPRGFGDATLMHNDITEEEVADTDYIEQEDEDHVRRLSGASTSDQHPHQQASASPGQIAAAG
mmetsp:Transcript_33182/g.91434  ORF Transcript_33182/g.91434 Transcript_33182/m.91434 type:complete len:359 (+) Transcript_33182:173-1249(+)